jgi:hypothetical protein
LSLQDRELGSAAFLLATISQNPRAIYPWPTAATDDYFEIKAKILLSCGFVPATEQPPYAELAEILTSDKVKQNNKINELFSY